MFQLYSQNEHPAGSHIMVARSVLSMVMAELQCLHTDCKYCFSVSAVSVDM